MTYRIVRPLLFCLPGETTHDLTLSLLKLSNRLMPQSFAKTHHAPCEVMGLHFENPVGLAAGLDKNGDYIDALARLGFGFIEIGTVTPRPQPGNARPRMFRLPQAGALINRMGFNNKGVDYLVNRVQQARFKGILGINIGKNRDTPAEQAVDDYLHCLQKVYSHASYITVNISSPNTAGLRDLQFGQNLEDLLKALKAGQQTLAEQYQCYKPIAIKIAPDLEADDIVHIGQALVAHEIDAVIATNTTSGRDGVDNMRGSTEQGGLSGAPLFAKSTAVVEQLYDVVGPHMPIIAVGGIANGDQAVAKIAAGASLVQVYTGLIYRGPGLISKAVNSIKTAGQK